MAGSENLHIVLAVLATGVGLFVLPILLIIPTLLVLLVLPTYLAANVQQRRAFFALGVGGAFAGPLALAALFDPRPNGWFETYEAFIVFGSTALGAVVCIGCGFVVMRLAQRTKVRVS